MKHEMWTPKSVFAAVALWMLIFTLALSQSQAQTADYTISKGDQLLVTVWGYNEFTTTQTVRDNNSITMPLLGDIMAGGLTKDELIASLRERLSVYIQGDINITISVLSSIGQRVTILGSVRAPGNYPISSEINLLELLSMAGGYAVDAQLTGIRIFHKDRLPSPTEVDLEVYLETSDIDNIPKIRPGDMVFVPKRENVIKEFGEFLRDVAFLFTLFRLTDVGR